MTTHDSIPAGLASWTDLGTPDLDAAIDFYGQLFGWTVERGTEEFGYYSIAQLGGRNVAGMMPIEPGSGQPAAWSTYVAVEDADGSAKLAKDNGATIFMEPMDVGTKGRMWVGADPTGAVFGVWQPRDHTGFQVTGESGAPCWFELITTDDAKAQQFYAAVFDWTYESIGDAQSPYTIAKVGDNSVGGIYPKPAELPAEVPSNWMPYFAVPDTDQAAATVAKNGGGIDREPFDIPYGRIAVVHDPWGAHFAVMVPQPPEGGH